MTAREEILGRINEALTVSASRTWEDHGTEHVHGRTATDGHSASEWLPSVGATNEAQIALFSANVAALRAEFEIVESKARLAERIAALAKENGWRSVGAHRAPLAESACKAIGLPVVWTDDGYDVSALEACDAGITECEALIAQTGSVLITARTCGGRVLSVLPPHHVVIARADQMMPDLPSAFEYLKQKYGEDWPSLTSFITGPSRTGDIERILVLGAHGPKRLTIFLVEEYGSS
jgi:L-lactate dehydrogenase complex protein LldG